MCSSLVRSPFSSIAQLDIQIHTLFALLLRYRETDAELQSLMLARPTHQASRGEISCYCTTYMSRATFSKSYFSFSFSYILPVSLYISLFSLRKIYNFDARVMLCALLLLPLCLALCGGRQSNVFIKNCVFSLILHLLVCFSTSRRKLFSFFFFFHPFPSIVFFSLILFDIFFFHRSPLRRLKSLILFFFLILSLRPPSKWRCCCFLRVQVLELSTWSIFSLWASSLWLFCYFNFSFLFFRSLTSGLHLAAPPPRLACSSLLPL